jgi:hypothetical protein
LLANRFVSLGENIDKHPGDRPWTDVAYGTGDESHWKYSPKL